MARLLTVLSIMLAPLLVLSLLLRGEPVARIAERLGRPPPLWLEKPGRTRKTKPPTVLWFHGASVGEVRAVLPLVLDFAGRLAAGDRVLVTVQSAQGYGVAAEALAEVSSVAVAMAPLDHPGVMARFCRRHSLRGLILYENEIWPGWLAKLRLRGVPVVLLDASLSARSLRFWAQRPGLSAVVRAGLDRVTTATAEQARALEMMGWGPVQVVPPLKLVGSALPVDHEELAAWHQWRRGGAALVVFANVHAGEIEAIKAICATQAVSGGQIIIAPRYPETVERFRSILGGEGPELAYWTGFGTLGTLYALGGTVVMGGGFDPRVGSHNPMEALRSGCAVVCGPHAGKQSAIIELLKAAGLIACWPDWPSFETGEETVRGGVKTDQLAALAAQAEQAAKAAITSAMGAMVNGPD